MVTLAHKRLLIGREPTLVLAGEIHYFRLARAEWGDRLAKLADLGCDTVATYIPWIVHEEREGSFELDAVSEFIDLCSARGLRFFARPGPFVMAELQNEGIPHWIYSKHPDAIPKTWDGGAGSSAVLDYLHPGFLADVRRWYGAVMPLLAARLQPKGGAVLAVQLDNEVGMLPWVTNAPDLSDDTLCDIARWITLHREAGRYPFDLDDPAARNAAFRSPSDAIAPRFLRDYGDYERDRYARYIATLRGYAEEAGVRGVPFVVNVHGTGASNGATYPIGLHQLAESYSQAPGYLAGSDHYFGEITRENVPDLYFMNAFTSASGPPENPISSVEFEVGSGDYSEGGSYRMTRSAADFKARLCVAQGNRLLNYYLLSGGRNPMLSEPLDDGSGRIAITGERHGFAAPIGPEGDLDATYFSLQRTTQALRAVGPKLADMDEEHDGLALAYVPDYYKTDFTRPGPIAEIVGNLAGIRGNLASLVRHLLLLNLRFPAVDLSRGKIGVRSLVFAGARHLDPGLQKLLVEHARGGGRLLLYGEVPHLDMEGRPCTVLLDALGIGGTEHRKGTRTFQPTIVSSGRVSPKEPGVRTYEPQTFASVPAGAEVFARLYSRSGDGPAIGVDAPLGKGRAVLLGSSYPFHRDFLLRLLARAGIVPAMGTDDPMRGTVVTTTRSPAGERFAHLLNMDDEPKSLLVTEGGRALFGGSRVGLGPREARMLPLGVKFGALTVVLSTAEIEAVDRGAGGGGSVAFRAGTAEELIIVRGERRVEGGRSESGPEGTWIRAGAGERVRVLF